MVKRLENEILEHICKVINQRDISLIDAFKEFDKGKKGFLVLEEFNMWLDKTGIK